MTIRAILFDFDGVIVNSEPIHLEKLQLLLAEEGILLTKEDYYKNYLGYDDRDCLTHVFQDFKKDLSEDKKQSLIHRKEALVLDAFQKGEILVPGVKDFIEKVSKDYYLAIVSGAVRSEILAILDVCDLKKYFKFIVGAEDVVRGKPSSEGYEKAIRLLNRDFVPSSEMLLPGECLVIEDSPWGLRAGHEAGCVCVGVTNTYGAERLEPAHFVVSEYTEILKHIV